MGKIRILPDDICHHIAAGEVVERPAAVVKELIENSLDAGSSHITVAFERGGVKLIQVIDDGEGMDREDALLALERHATSKIRSVEDLHNIKSFGFRGEALASISAVSRFELITKRATEEIGTRVLVEGGVLKSVEPLGCPVGCAVTVRDLFFNVAARRKFLKSENTERQHILDQIRRLALVSHHVHFELYENKKRLWNYPKTEDPQERILQLFELRPSQRLTVFNLQRNGVSIRGYLGDPSMGRPTTSSTFLFVNGRPFRDALIQKTLRDACRSFVPEGFFPFVVLFLQMDPGDIDVNVHPTKQEVRFRNLGLLLSLIKEAILEGRLQMESWSPFTDVSIDEPPKKALYLKETSARYEGSSPQQKPLPIEPSFFECRRSQVALNLPVSVLGVLDNTYIVCSTSEGLVLVDFHAAHERILYNRLISTSLPLPSQELTMPLLLPMSSEEISTVEKNRSNLLMLGYDVEPFGKDTLAIRAIPAIGTEIRHKEVLGEIIRKGLGDESEGRLLEEFASAIACHGALRAGMFINDETICWLLDKILKEPDLFTCPHGRPVWITISLKEIYKRFGRGS